MSKENPREVLLKDLEEIYALAMANGNLTAALRAKELLGKGEGFFSSACLKKRVSLMDLADEDLERLIQEIDSYQPQKKET